MSAVAPALSASLALLEVLQEKTEGRPPLPLPYAYPFSPPLFLSLLADSTPYLFFLPLHFGLFPLLLPLPPLFPLLTPSTDQHACANLFP